MAAREESEEFVYRMSAANEWDELQKNGSTFGGQLDRSTVCFHLSKLDQTFKDDEIPVQSTLQNFFLNRKVELYLLQIDAKKFGDGLIYERVDDLNSFPLL